ncbi:MAG: hypothetical protein EOP42_06665 [Sphingobacteriaceae bacterium]|nr:MAG: hypothetical protein EOP42_06665 [Sphingobacteriaceae bacterium]
MTSIQNIQPLTAEALFDILKKEFPDYINEKLDSALTIEFAHVADIINISFPEVAAATVLTVTVSDDNLVVTNNETESESRLEYNTALLEGHLVDFLKMKAE